MHAQEIVTSIGENPSPTPPHKGEGLNCLARRINVEQGRATGFLPPCGGDGRQARRGLFTLLLLFFISFLAPLPAFAVNPDEVLSNPALEHRARNLSMQLRCMVCQNQSIDDSNAELARDLRVLVRERLTDGDTDEQVIDYVVSRYGEFVLLKPRLSAKTIILWATPVILLLIGAAAILVFIRTRPNQRPVAALTADEQARIDELLKK
jgi:cytochrome c-type biogenesis protein CcmH